MNSITQKSKNSLSDHYIPLLRLGLDDSQAGGSRGGARRASLRLKRKVETSLFSKVAAYLKFKIPSPGIPET